MSGTVSYCGKAPAGETHRRRNMAHGAAYSVGTLTLVEAARAGSVGCSVLPTASRSPPASHLGSCSSILAPDCVHLISERIKAAVSGWRMPGRPLRTLKSGAKPRRSRCCSASTPSDDGIKPMILACGPAFHTALCGGDKGQNHRRGQQDAGGCPWGSSWTHRCVDVLLSATLLLLPSHLPY